MYVCGELVKFKIYKSRNSSSYRHITSGKTAKDLKASAGVKEVALPFSFFLFLNISFVVLFNILYTLLF